MAQDKPENLPKELLPLTFVYWPEFYSTTLSHLMNHNLKVGLPVQFYYSYGDTFLVADTMAESLKKDAVELNLMKPADASKYTKQIEKEIKKMLDTKTNPNELIPFFDKDGTGFLINFKTFAVHLVRNKQDYVKTPQEVVEKLYKENKVLSLLRNKLPNFIKKICLEKPAPTQAPVAPLTPPRAPPKSDWKTELDSRIEKYYRDTISKEETLKNFEDFIRMMIKDPNANVVQSIKSGSKQTPRQIGANQKFVKKEELSILVPPESTYVGRIGLIARNTILQEGGKDAKEFCKKYGCDLDEAKKYEVEKTFDEYYRLIFDNKDTYIVDGNIEVRRGAVARKTSLLKKDEAEMKRVLKDASEIKAEKFVAPMNLGNVNLQEFERAQQQAKKLAETAKKAPSTAIVEQVVAESRPTVNRNLETMKIVAASEEGKKQKPIKTILEESMTSLVEEEEEEPETPSEGSEYETDE